MTIQENVGEMERKLAEAGLSPDDICRDAGINRSTWTRWKSGAVAPNLSTWDRVCRSADALLGRNQNASEAAK